MVRFKKKFYFLPITEVWFGYAGNIVDKIGLTTWQHVKNNRTKIWGVPHRSYTVENRLDESAELIFSKYGKTVQTEIKQAEKLNINCIFHDDYKGFAEFYNEFAKNRKIAAITVERLNEMKGSLKLSYALLDNIKVAAHSYLVDEDLGIARLLHAASKRLDEQFDKQAAGKINKLLHYHDMIYFKKSGYVTYDFGGYAENTNDKGLQGINRFKLSFGGEKIVCNNYSSLSYFLFKKMAGWLGLIDH